MPLPENLNGLTLDHCNALLGEAEGPHLDFKRDLPRPDNASRHEFLADVSAFANSTGGDLVYGIDEDGEARASALTPVAGNPDEEVRRLQDTILNGLEPRAPGVQVKSVPVGDRFLVVVRVPQSWAGPHRVRTNQHFFVREGARKRQLDMPEIRSMFLRTEAQVQRVRDFRTERIGRLLAGDTPVRLVPGSIEVLHLIPTQAALGLLSPDPVQYMRQRALPALAVTGLNMRLNIDGALGVRTVQAEGSHGYSLFFRNGFFEATKVLTSRQDGRTVLASLSYEEEMIALLDVFRAELRRLGAGEEMTAMLTLVRAGRMDLGVDRARFDVLGDEGRFDREVVAVPDVLLSADQPPATALRPLFDLVWQAAGFERSFNYDQAGNWVGRR